MKMRAGNFISVLLYQLGLLCCVRMCSVKVSEIPVQSDFLFDNYTESAWNTVKYNRFIKINGMTKLLSSSDQTTLFGWKNTKAIVVNSARFFFRPTMSICYSDTGNVDFLDNKPAKMYLKYHNKEKGLKHEQNHWVLYTDYSKIAIVYACQDPKLQNGNGICDPQHSYIWILAKNTTLTEAEDLRAKEMAISVCITEDLKTIDHDQPCDRQAKL